ncbi:hypothetical protein CCACVL1_09283 [Corchorus capsularis]|uniref:Uncharacterized protein n=1 Tax=Corchorus capsularis TaxID=210143 RepID=A0A1R3IWT8_COCAP|nr:hypothetical protein CCACVL1_09283 [Corchorus capsularis]
MGVEIDDGFLKERRREERRKKKKGKMKSGLAHVQICAPNHEHAVKLGRCVAAYLKQFDALNTDALDKFVQSHE